MTAKMVDRKAIWYLCLRAARGIYQAKPPTDAYAQFVALQLFGIIAKESGFRYQRQLGFEQRRDGAWGLCQCEPGSVSDSLDMLRRDALLRLRVVTFLQENGMDFDPFKVSVSTVCELLKLGSSDAIDVVFARMHLLRIPSAVPGTIREQAADWKEFYNTIQGKGTVAEYLRDWDELCAPVLELLGVRFDL